jgi:diguanylate cyclase (GGDEF)-like protein
VGDDRGSSIAALEAILGANEQRILERMLGEAHANGFLGFVSVREESWRASIRRLGAALLSEAAWLDGRHGIAADEDPDADPAHQFGREEGLAHRSRGVTLRMFLSLLTHYRAALIALVRDDAEPELVRTLTDLANGFFDRMVIGLVDSWGESEPETVFEEMRIRARQATNEKDLYKTVLDGVNIPILLLDDDGGVVTTNAAVHRVFDIPELAVLPIWGEHAEHPRIQLLTAEIAAFLESGDLHWSAERELATRDGERHFVIELQRIRDVSSAFAGTTLILTDVTVHRELQDAFRRAEHSEYLATHDELTGLPNRRWFEDALRVACARTSEGTVSTLLFIDINEFKMCNDVRGHAFGDEVLMAVGDALSSELRENDTLARLGGDEFGVILHGASAIDAESVVERMRRSVDATGRSISFGISLSVGVVEAVAGATTQQLLAIADGRMYIDKAANRQASLKRA